LIITIIANHFQGQVALAGQTAGRIRVVLDFLFLLYQDKRKSKKQKEEEEEGYYYKKELQNVSSYHSLQIISRVWWRWPDPESIRCCP
jgi:hypothetical protein